MSPLAAIAGPNNEPTEVNGHRFPLGVEESVHLDGRQALRIPLLMRIAVPGPKLALAKVS